LKGVADFYYGEAILGRGEEEREREEGDPHAFVSAAMPSWDSRHLEPCDGTGKGGEKGRGGESYRGLASSLPRMCVVCPPRVKKEGEEGRGGGCIVRDDFLLRPLAYGSVGCSASLRPDRRPPC